LKKKKEDSFKTDIDYEHLKAKITAAEHSSKVLHQQNPLTIPCGRQPKKLKRVKKLLHHLGHLKELVQEAALKKHMLSLNT
jgi:hypothetical protein